MEISAERLKTILNNILNWGSEHDEEFRETLIDIMDLSEDEIKELDLLNYVDDLDHSEYLDLDEAKEDKDMKTCCICGKKFKGWGNNPYPVCKGADDVCCDNCNYNEVIPARLANFNKKEKNEALIEKLKAVDKYIRK